jgi:hypothetical protein
MEFGPPLKPKFSLLSYKEVFAGAAIMKDLEL